MHESYKDITSKIATPPLWWDSNGTPRYDEFSPEFCPNIYAGQVFLLRICCQYCGRQFDVELHTSYCDRRVDHPHELHYGDPPAHDCVGDSMNCEDLAVLQVWNRDRSMEWQRLKKLEGLIE